MTDTSMKSGAARPSVGIVNATPGDRLAGSAWLSLPPELWQRIVELLLPPIVPEHSIHPQPNFKITNHAKECVRTSDRDIVALASSCRQLRTLVTPVLYHAAFLGTGRQASRLARTISRYGDDEGAQERDAGRLAHRIRALHVACKVTAPRKRVRDAVD